MLKNKLLNSDIISILSRMGHYDTICIADIGLPISKNVKRIDLAICNSYPSFEKVLKIIFENMIIQKVYLAKEVIEKNSKIHKKVLGIIKNTEISYIDHEQFKEQAKMCIAIIRTGECTPFSNIILESGVNF